LETWIEFGRGPLFVLSYALLGLGLARILLLTLINVAGAYGRSWDRIINWKDVRLQTRTWLFPLRSLLRKRPVYSALSVIFHIGLILVPLFAAAHVLLWRRYNGFAWGAMPQRLADVLTVTTIAAGIGLLLGRVIPSASRKLSGLQEYLWPALLLVPFVTGFICSHAHISAHAYQQFMLLHVYSADLILALLPFTRIAHCVLMPISQVVTAVAWKFPVGAGDRVADTLGYEGRPTWIAKSRLEPPADPEPQTSRTTEKPAAAAEEVRVG
jgi:nitrate reductase gamma subunit